MFDQKEKSGKEDLAKFQGGVFVIVERLVTWIFWWMSCLRTSIVGPILSAKRHKGRKDITKETKFINARCNKKNIRKGRKNLLMMTTNQELEAPSCRDVRKAWLVYEYGEHQDYL